MFDLNATLGLQSVEADPNNIPDGRYDGVITKSEYVLTKTGKVSHVTTITVKSADKYNGAQKQKWDNLGKNPVKADGTPAENIAEVAGFESTLTETNKTWYKKFWLDLGIDTDTVAAKPEMLVNKAVTFGVKRNAEGFQNINFIQLRTPEVVTDMSAVPGAAPVTLSETPASNPFNQGQAAPQSLPQF